jgi:prepilin peptidase CpaA
MLSSTTAFAALIFLPFILPIVAWVFWSDLTRMKIPNKAVIALIGVYAVVGIFVFEIDEYLWRWAHFAVLLVVGFILTIARAIGGGDAKFAAAIAPFVALSDAIWFLILLAILNVACLILHRLVQYIPILSNATRDWESYKGRRRLYFPMGLSLGASLVTYLVLAAT